MLCSINLLDNDLHRDTVNDFSYCSHYITTRIHRFFACDFLYISSSTLNSIAELGVDDSGFPPLFSYSLSLPHFPDPSSQL